MTKEYKDLTDEEKQALSQDGLKILNNQYIRGIASGGLAQNYGDLAKELYFGKVTKVPDEFAYQSLFLPTLADYNGEQGASLNAPYLRKKAINALVEGISYLKLDDLMSYLKIEQGTKDKYSGKYLQELPEETQKEIFGNITGIIVDEEISDLMPERIKKRKGKLEEIICNPEKNKDE